MLLGSSDTAFSNASTASLLNPSISYRRPICFPRKEEWSFAVTRDSVQVGSEVERGRKMFGETQARRHVRCLVEAMHVYSLVQTRGKDKGRICNLDWTFAS